MMSERSLMREPWSLALEKSTQSTITSLTPNSVVVPFGSRQHLTTTKRLFLKDMDSFDAGLLMERDAETSMCAVIPSSMALFSVRLASQNRPANPTATTLDNLSTGGLQKMTCSLGT